MKIKICQMGDSYLAPLTFRICRDNTIITYFETKETPLKTYESTDMNNYIKTKETHKDYGNFLFGGTI